MTDPKKIIRDLEDIISKNISSMDIPVVKGNTIRIRHIVIRPKKTGEWLLVDSKENKTIITMFSKIGAIAFAKAYIASIHTKFVEKLDKQLEKEYNDSVFYAHNLKKTTDIMKKDIIRCRFEVSQQKIDSARSALDNFIMDHIN